ncbi:MAG: AAA family ATPase [Chloroflexi bacterium]|nr:AAA family ATPase [Chloroflexota bacterium]
MGALRLYVLGPPRLQRNGEPLDLSLRRALALLVYLALAGRSRRRETLASLFWPDGGEREARGRLRRTLHRLGEAVGESVVVSESESLRLSPALDLWVDSLVFERQAFAVLDDAPLRSEQEKLALASEAVALYADDLLAGFSLPDSPGWEEWQFLERERLRQTYVRLLRYLVDRHHHGGAPEQAIPYARRWLALDSLHEPAHRSLIELYAATDQWTAALRQYQECVRLLREELGVAPSDETVALYETVRARRLPRPASERPAAPARVAAAAVANEASSARPAPPSAPPPHPQPPTGRELELRVLLDRLELARSGRRQVVFVTGDAGLGKTTLVEVLLTEAARLGVPWIGQGQCLDHQGVGEAYLPILEALGRLCRQPDGKTLATVLARHAPTWLVQLPGAVSQQAMEALRLRVIGATQERMLREMAEALEFLCAEQPLVLVVEDLQWSDYSTLDLLTRLAQRPEPARLMVVGTYRPADAMTRDHPLQTVVRQLLVKGHCLEIALTPLDESAVGAYLERRFPGLEQRTELAALLHQQTDGNPLFMANVVETWIEWGALANEAGAWVPRTDLAQLAEAVPDSLRDLVEQQLDRLSAEDQELLEVASVAGTEFPVAVVAAVLDLPEERVEARCLALARRGQLLPGRGAVEWPDGTLTARFRYSQHLYREIMYARVPATRKVRLHRQIGTRLETAYGTRAPELAGELALHFWQGRDGERAAGYFLHGARLALQRSAHREAIGHLFTGLSVVSAWPESEQRDRRELALLLSLAPALLATEGWRSTEAEQALQRAHTLYERLGEPREYSQVLFMLAALHEWRAEYQQSQRWIEQRLAEMSEGRQEQDEWLIESYDLLACSLFHQGAFGQALERAEQGLARYDPSRQYTLIAAFGVDPGVQTHGWAALSDWFLGHPDRALERVHTALSLAKTHLYSLALAQLQAAWVHQLRLDHRLTLEWARSAATLAAEQGFPYLAARGAMLEGWALAMDGQYEIGLTRLQEGLAACQAAGAMIDFPYYLGLLAEARGRASQAAHGLDAIAEAQKMVANSRAFFYEAELHRLEGALLLQTGGSDSVSRAEASFTRALDIARDQGAKMLELRAAVSLAQFWNVQDRPREACLLVADQYDRFAEGFATTDLRAAELLLEGVGGLARSEPSVTDAPYGHRR